MDHIVTFHVMAKTKDESKLESLKKKHSKGHQAPDTEVTMYVFEQKFGSEEKWIYLSILYREDFCLEGVYFERPHKNKGWEDIPEDTYDDKDLCEIPHSLIDTDDALSIDRKKGRLLIRLESKPEKLDWY